MLAAASESRSANHGTVELVMTAPADSDAYHRDTKVVVTDLFRRAEKSVLVAGFAVHQGRRIFHELAARMRDVECLQVRIFLNLTTSQGDAKDHSLWASRFASQFADRHWPKDHPLPELYFDRRVLDYPDRGPVSFHAKCVVRDESELFVSSANFTEAAQNRNIEMGLTVQSVPLATQAAKFFGEMVRAGICIRAI
jgi:phosphatidylserine/phosphatidylglycerophosphate/cardiolipin synthase-like enzyme